MPGRGLLSIDRALARNGFDLVAQAIAETLKGDGFGCPGNITQGHLEFGPAKGELR